MKGKQNISGSNFFAISLIIGLFVLFLISNFSYQQIVSLKKTEKLVNQSFKVQILLKQLLSHIKDAETGGRSFIATGDSSFLELYNNTPEMIIETVKALDVLTNDNKEQRNRLDLIKPNLKKEMDLLRRMLMENSSSNANSSAKIGLQTITLKKIMLNLRMQINEMFVIENNLLLKRQTAHNSKMSTTPLLSLLLLIFSLFILVVGFYQINADIKGLRALNSKLIQIKSEFEEKNTELDFQNIEKEKRADELIIANKELAFQNTEKQMRADELIIANKELAFQNIEKEKRANELININNELLSFSYIASHDLQEPLRKIQLFISKIMDDKEQSVSEKNVDYFKRMQASANRMQHLINDLLSYSKVNEVEKTPEPVDLNEILKNVISEFTLMQTIAETKTKINCGTLPSINGTVFQLEQLFTNLITNSIKYSSPERTPVIEIVSSVIKGEEVPNKNTDKLIEYYKITVADNGIGFEQEYAEKIFLLFQRLHNKQTYSGTGIGLTICRKIVENHHGFIAATSNPNLGTTISIYLPV